jgi:tungstate transport system substrate-binding protein
MREVLNMAAELQAYTLTDRATYSAYRGKTGLAIALESDPRMFNSYGIKVQRHQLQRRDAID